MKDKIAADILSFGMTLEVKILIDDQILFHVFCLVRVSSGDAIFKTVGFHCITKFKKCVLFSSIKAVNFYAILVSNILIQFCTVFLMTPGGGGLYDEK